MKQDRLLWLLGVMGALIVLRWWGLSQTEAEPEVVAAIVRPQSDAASAAQASANDSVPLLRPEGGDVAGDAFPVRVVKQPPPLPPQPVLRPVKVVGFMGPIEPPPPPPPPAPSIQVIGTWDDGSGKPGVFVAIPQGTVLVRQGGTLMSDYRVTAVTSHELLITHAVTKHEWRFPVPRATATR